MSTSWRAPRERLICTEALRSKLEDGRHVYVPSIAVGATVGCTLSAVTTPLAFWLVARRLGLVTHGPGLRPHHLRGTQWPTAASSAPTGAAAQP
jgi:hypothetical protein